MLRQQEQRAPSLGRSAFLLAALSAVGAPAQAFVGTHAVQVAHAPSRLRDRAIVTFASEGSSQDESVQATRSPRVRSRQQCPRASADVLAQVAAAALSVAFVFEAGAAPALAAPAGRLATPVALIQAADAAPLPSRAKEKPFNIINEVEKLERETEELDKLKLEAQKTKARAKQGKAALPFVSKKEDFRFIKVGPPRLELAKSKIRALEPYLDETEYLITARKWDYLSGLLGVFTEQEEEFVDLIDGLFPTQSAADVSAREAMQYEAQRIFLAIDDLHQASQYKRARSAEGAYARLALAYDRFLKAGNLLPRYDPVTSTEPLFQDVPDEALRYDRNSKTPPKAQDAVLILRGPDKGRTGRVLGVVKSRGEGVVKVEGAMREVKLLDLSDLGKLLPDDAP